MGQGYIQSNPPHVVSWLHLLKTAIVQDPIILLFVDYAISILLTSNQKRVYQLWPYDVKYRRQCIWRQSCNGISSDVILSSLVRRTQTAIFFNFLGHKNEVYRKLKPLQEKVKYMFIAVPAEKKNQLNQSSYRHGGLEKGSLFDYKNGRYKKIRIFLAKRLVPPGAHW